MIVSSDKMGQMKNENALSWAGYSTYLCLYITDLGENIIAHQTANYVVLCSASV